MIGAHAQGSVRLSAERCVIKVHLEPAAARRRMGKPFLGHVANADAMRFHRDPAARLDSTADEARGLPIGEAA